MFLRDEDLARASYTLLVGLCITLPYLHMHCPFQLNRPIELESSYFQPHDRIASAGRGNANLAWDVVVP